MIDLTHKTPIPYLLLQLGGVKTKSEMERRLERKYPNVFADTQPIRFPRNEEINDLASGGEARWW
jgi:hypothetical protein